MLKKSIALLTLAATLSACGPAPQPPAEPVPPVPAAAATPAAAPAPEAERAEAPRPAPRPRPRPAPEREAAAAPAPPPVCGDCGVIASVTEQRVKGDATAIGTLGGAAAGGVAGSQFGSKSGKVLATIGGAVLGGLAGREVEKQVRATHVYDVVVNMEAGGSRTVRVEKMDGLAVGSHVRVQGDTLVPN